MSPSDVLPVYPFGTVLQHPRIKHVAYLVLRVTPNRWGNNHGNSYIAIGLSSGSVVTIGHSRLSEWNVLEYGNVR